MALSLGGLLPPSGHVPTPQKGWCYHLCPWHCTWGGGVYFYQHHIAKEMWAERRKGGSGSCPLLEMHCKGQYELNQNILPLFLEKHTGCCHRYLPCLCIRAATNDYLHRQDSLSLIVWQIKCQKFLFIFFFLNAWHRFWKPQVITSTVQQTLTNMSEGKAANIHKWEARAWECLKND